MDVLDVPRQNGVDTRVNEHHEENIEQVVVVVFHGRYRDVVPLDAHAFDLIEREVLGAPTKRSRGEKRL